MQIILTQKDTNIILKCQVVSYLPDLLLSQHRYTA